MKWIFVGAFAVLLTTGAFAGLVEREETYTDGSTTMRGFLVYDDAVDELRPGILVVSEWWGLDEYARRRARMLAEQGYFAMAVDPYGNGETADNPDDARRLATGFFANIADGLARIRAARSVLDAQPQVDPARIAIVGFCFGGTVALSFANAGEDVALAASFHGGLKIPAVGEQDPLRARVLVYHGGADETVSEGDVRAFEQQLRRRRASYKVIIYPDAKHAFSSPKADDYAAKFHLPVAYNAEADRASWADFLSELKTAFTPRVEEEEPTQPVDAATATEPANAP